MTRIIHGTGVGVTHGAGDGLSEFPSDLADVGTAGSAVAFSVQASDTSALVTLASCMRGSDASALPMRVLVAGPAAAVADSRSSRLLFEATVTEATAIDRIGRTTLGFRRPADADANQILLESAGVTGGLLRALMLVAVAATSGCLGARRAVPDVKVKRLLWDSKAVLCWRLSRAPRLLGQTLTGSDVDGVLQGVAGRCN